MRRIEINHTTRYEYAEPVELLTHKLHLRPREGHDIRIESSKLSIEPNYKIVWERDIYGNSIALVDFADKSPSLEIRSEVIVQHYAQQPLEFSLDDSALHYPFHYNPLHQIDLIPYQMAVFPRDYPVVQQWLEAVCKPGKLMETAVLLDALNRAIASGFEYQIREEPGVQSPQQTIESGSGSCRDFAALFIEACRVLGFASRFVSGYLLVENAQHLATHAWSEVYLPGSGWRGFDSTSGTLAGGDHIAVAQHRHPEAIPPVSGSFVGKPGPLPIMNVNVSVKIL
ncbi:MAG: transglutaminase family protein [Gammaproteobacteria bacterium]|nr:transglutaminase family protein [Gammaproteobacteria bacterium]